jgi:hypothetical protein
MAITKNELNGMTDASYDSVKDTFPASVASTSGTLSTVNGLNTRVIGVGTVFLTDVKKGDYIWFTTTDEVRRVENVTDDLTLTLKSAVATTVTAGAFKIVPKNGYEAISWSIASTGAATINGITYEASMSNSIGSQKPNSQGGGRNVAPVLIDSTANTNIVFVSAW